jgi:hypothetical protein
MGKSIGAPDGEPGGVHLLVLFEFLEGSGNGARLIKSIWAPFLDPDYVRSLSLGVIRNFYEGPGLP